MSNKKFAVISIVVTVLISSALALSIVFINHGRENDYDYWQTIADDEFAEGQADYIEKYPVVVVFPIVEEDWRIDYGVCETSDGAFCIMISANDPVYYSEAMYALNQLEDYEEGKYNIEFFKLIEEDI